MDEKNTFDTNEAMPQACNLADETAARERLELLLMSAGGGRLIGIFADEADDVAEGLVPTPLPHAPPAVRGVVSIGGRMLTVLDPLVLLTEPNNDKARAMPSCVVALRGDEQLALAVERIEHPIEIFTAMIKPFDHAGKFVRGTVPYGEALVVLLNPQEIFGAAMQGWERRRQRTFRSE